MDRRPSYAHFSSTSNNTTGVFALIECFKLAGLDAGSGLGFLHVTVQADVGVALPKNNIADLAAVRPRVPGPGGSRTAWAIEANCETHLLHAEKV